MPDTPSAPAQRSTVLALVGRVPWIVWAAIIPALIIGSSKLYTGGGVRVPVVGAGPIAALRPDDAPAGTHIVVEARAHEAAAETARRVRETIARWPDVIVIALDPATLGDDPAATVTLLGQLAHEAQNATAVPVIVDFGHDDTDPIRIRAEQDLRQGPCRSTRRHVCVSLGDTSDEDGVRAAVQTGIADALSLHRQWRASTQHH